jgi:hypothetical protein
VTDETLSKTSTIIQILAVALLIGSSATLPVSHAAVVPVQGLDVNHRGQAPIHDTNDATLGSAHRASTPLPYLSRITHRTIQPGSADRSTLVTEEASGTVVGPHTILTHGHCRAFRDPDNLEETMVISIRQMDALIPYLVDVADIGTAYADRGTTLLVLPDRVRLPQAAELGNPRRLEVGDPISIRYWDDANNRFATLETVVLHVAGNRARLLDAQQVIGPGDSGSGAFNAQGQLVGNIWSIGMQYTGQRLPWIEIALLPAGITQYIH